MFILMILLSSCATQKNICDEVNCDQTSTIINASKDLYTKDMSKEIEGCIDNCINNEVDLKTQLQSMIETLDNYLIANNYALEACNNSENSRTCYEDIEQLGWSNYLNYRDYFIKLLDYDYEYRYGGMWSFDTIDICSGTQCPITVYFGLYLDDNVLRVNNGIMINLFDYHQGFRTETVQVPLALNSGSSSGVYKYNTENSIFELYYYKKDDLFMNKSLKINNDGSLYEKSQNGEITKASTMNGINYSYTESIQSILTVWTKDIQIHHLYIKDETNNTKYISSGGNYHIRLNALLFPNWDKVIELQNDVNQYIKTPYLYQNNTRIHQIQGYAFQVYNYENRIEIEFTIKSKDLFDFMNKLDIVLLSQNENSISYLYNALEKFALNPEDYIIDDDFDYLFEDQYFIDFFQLD